MLLRLSRTFIFHFVDYVWLTAACQQYAAVNANWEHRLRIHTSNIQQHSPCAYQCIHPYPNLSHVGCSGKRTWTARTVFFSHNTKSNWNPQFHFHCRKLVACECLVAGLESQTRASKIHVRHSTQPVCRHIHRSHGRLLISYLTAGHSVENRRIIMGM